MEDKATNQTEGQQDDEQNRVWEINHKKILDALHKASEFFGTHLPTITQLAEITGLSRQTVYRHINSSSSHPAYRQRSALFESMQQEVLLEICRRAMTGDLQAAKLYLQLTGKIEPKGANKAPLNNNIQINGIVLNRQIVENLSREQLKKIEDIIKETGLN